MHAYTAILIIYREEKAHEEHISAYSHLLMRDDKLQRTKGEKTLHRSM